MLITDVTPHQGDMTIRMMFTTMELWSQLFSSNVVTHFSVIVNAQPLETRNSCSHSLCCVGVSPGDCHTALV